MTVVTFQSDSFQWKKCAKVKFIFKKWFKKCQLSHLYWRIFCLVNKKIIWQISVVLYFFTIIDRCWIDTFQKLNLFLTNGQKSVSCQIYIDTYWQMLYKWGDKTWEISGNYYWCLFFLTIIVDRCQIDTFR